MRRSTAPQHAESDSQCMSRTLFLRLVFVASLVTAAAVCGLVAFRVIRNLEQEVGEQTYESVANSALTTAQEISLRKIQGGDIMATILSYAFPNKDAWPFVALDGYEVIAGKVANMSASSSQIVAAIVLPEQRADFETFAQNLYRSNNYPETSGFSDFGFGAWAEDNETSPYDDGRVHDVNGTVSPQSDRDILIILYQHNLVTANSIMANLHSIPVQGHALVQILDCVDKYATEETPAPQCGFITDFTELIRRPGPACMIFKPIYPQNDQTSAVAFAGTTMYLDEVLVNVVPDYVRGLYVVFSTDTESHTFLMDEGVPILLGEGDLHDPSFDEYARSAVLYSVETNATGSATYTITLYPSDTLFATFETNSPMVVSLGLVMVICFSISMFFLYDYFMKYESHQRKTLLEMKRRFVRFVSHEIRTPLNTVGMGLALLQSEMMSGVLETLRSNSLVDSFESNGEMKRSSSSPEMALAAAGNITRASEPDSKDTTKSRPYYSKEQVDLCLKNWLSLTKEIHENSEAAVAVLTDLLDFDKIQTGTLKLDVSRVQIWELVHRTSSQFQIHANNKHVTMDLVFPQVSLDTMDQGRVIKEFEHLLVIGDDMKLSQCLRNLISNALKFTPESGIVTIETSYMPNGLPNVQSTEYCFKGDVFPRSGSVRISVKDTGPGMSSEQQEQLFQEFVQFDPNKLQAGGGSGLGLCIAKEIIEQHKGSILATSEGLGKGSTFIIELPLYSFPIYREDSSCRQSNQTSVSEEISDLIANFHHHILVVDDVLSNRKFLAKLLERAGHTVQVAKNGQEAIDAVKDDLEKLQSERHVPFDTILLDSEMPVLCGPEAAKSIRELRHPATIVGCTGNVLPEDVAYFKSCGAATVLPKPIKISMLESFWREQGIASTI
ncbi:hypothetical protein FisN_21Hh286 [Fistulifera solaris]|uniref:histidine kinase n=1 Tax=Fistulifera solaris TaxID=1519565 RepID=A0A1Z5KNT0_FISSO|nr:hypothetical protein FisN_21Hh286 [Fistulifera solaris]|eukprot:GAX27936.1 hypothetical protein FisN_21Hh286 [Fistulifera solaris]